ncbi:MAG: SIS domain-containing protein [Planctomycetota bacterium]
MSTKAEEVNRLLDGAAASVEALHDRASSIAEIADLIAEALRNGNGLLLCGNGGSAAQCQHIAAEFTGRFKLERQALPAVALTTDTSALTAIGNDYGFETIFERQVEAVGRRGDVLVGLSTSGRSANVLNAFQKAGEMGIRTVALVGPRLGGIADAADLTLAAPGDSTANVQECHLVALHIVCELVERELAEEG